MSDREKRLSDLNTKLFEVCGAEFRAGFKLGAESAIGYAHKRAKKLIKQNTYSEMEAAIDRILHIQVDDILNDDDR